MRRLSRAWIVAIAAVVVLLVAVGGYAGHDFTTRDHFCASCHAYEKASWDYGDHPETGCLDCHSKGFFYDKWQGTRKVWLVFTGQVNPHNDPLPGYPKATTENCKACHMEGEGVDEALPFFLARHEFYMQHAETCMACHESGHRLRIRDQRDIPGRLIRGAVEMPGR